MKLLIVILFSLKTLISQSLTDFKYLKDTYTNQKYLGFAGSYSTLKNKTAPNSKAHNMQSFNININYKSINFNIYKTNYIAQIKLIPDLFFLLDKKLNNKKNEFSGENSNVTSGILGWHSLAYNIKVKKKQCYSLGFAINDYFLGNNYKDSANRIVTLEPQGWWLSIGPVAMFHFTLGKNFICHSFINYNIGYYKPINLSYAMVNKNYPNPHFLNTHLELISTLGIFIGADYTAVINRGNIPSKVRRVDYLLGFKFVL